MGAGVVVRWGVAARGRTRGVRSKRVPPPSITDPVRSVAAYIAGVSTAFGAGWVVVWLPLAPVAAFGAGWVVVWLPLAPVAALGARVVGGWSVGNLRWRRPFFLVFCVCIVYDFLEDYRPGA